MRCLLEVSTEFQDNRPQHKKPKSFVCTYYYEYSRLETDYARCR